MRYPENRMLGGKHHLDFARRFRRWGHDDVLRLYHQDAEFSLVQKLQWPDTARDAAFFRDRERGMIVLMHEHGAILRSVSGALYGDYLQNIAAAALVVGRRRAAIGHILRLIVARPLWTAGWKLLVAAILGPSLALRVRRLWRRRN